MNLVTYIKPKPGCFGLSLPAVKTCPALTASIQAADRKGKASICRSCYACAGRYRFGNVKKSLEERYRWWKSHAPDERAAEIVKVMERKHPKNKRFFRCYSSGDLDGPGAIRTWEGVALAMPEMHIWLPTRTWCLDSMLPLLQELNTLPNVTVRPSAHCFDDEPVRIKGLAAGTSSALEEAPLADIVCPESCEECRVCWKESELSVSYKPKIRGQNSLLPEKLKEAGRAE